MGVQKQSTTIQTESHDFPASTVSLLEGETVIEAFRPSLWNWAKFFLVGIATALLAVQAFSEGQVTAGAGAAAVTIVVTGYAYFSRERSRYVVTDQRVIKSVGLVRLGSEDIRIADVRGVSTSRGLRHRLMRTGTVETRSIGGENPLTMQNFKGYTAFARAIRTQQQTIEESIGPGSISVSVEDERYN